MCSSSMASLREILNDRFACSQCCLFVFLLVSVAQLKGTFSLCKACPDEAATSTINHSFLISAFAVQGTHLDFLSAAWIKVLSAQPFCFVPSSPFAFSHSGYSQEGWLFCLSSNQVVLKTRWSSWACNLLFGCCCSHPLRLHFRPYWEPEYLFCGLLCVIKSI